MAAAPGVRRSELGEALRACRDAFIGVGVMSCMINLLYLTGSIFMLEVYDRVLPSRSVPTLVGLAILATGLYAAQGSLDLIRGRILGRIGTSLDEALNARVFETVEMVAKERRKRVTTGEMNRFLKTVDFERASVPERSRVRIFYMTQAAVSPPTFIIFTDKNVKLHFSYERFLQNQIREAFGFIGSPIWIKNRARQRRDFVPNPKK